MPTHLSQKEIKDVLNAVQRLSGIDTLESFCQESLSLLHDLFHTDKSIFFMSRECNNMTNFDMATISGRGISNKAIRLFRQYYHQLDPFRNTLNNIDRYPLVITFEQVLPLKKLVKTEYYNFFLKPQTIHDEMAIYLVSGNRILGVTAVFRTRRSQVFSQTDKAKAEMIAPFLTTALDRAAARQKSDALEHILTSLSTDLPYEGIIVLDHSLSLIYSSENIHNLIPILPSKMRPHRPFIKNLPEKLQSACMDAMACRHHTYSPKSRLYESELSMSTAPNESIIHLRTIQSAQNKPLLVLCINQTSKAQISRTLLHQLGISLREMDIIRLLSQGKKNSEIGTSLFISEYTVENHLRSIYRKIGVKNRTELVSKLISHAHNFCPSPSILGKNQTIYKPY